MRFVLKKQSKNNNALVTFFNNPSSERALLDSLIKNILGGKDLNELLKDPDILEKCSNSTLAVSFTRKALKIPVVSNIFSLESA